MPDAIATPPAAAPVAPNPSPSPAAPAPNRSPRMPVPPVVAPGEMDQGKLKALFHKEVTEKAPKVESRPAGVPVPPGEVAKPQDAKPATRAAPAADKPASILASPEKKADHTPAALANKEQDLPGPEDSLKLPDGVSDSVNSHFNNQKKLLKSERWKNLELTQKIEQAQSEHQRQIEIYKKSAPADSAAFETLKAEHKALSDRLLTVDLQNHPDFHRQFVEPVNKAKAEVEMLLTDNAVEGAPAFADLLAKPRVEFAKAVSELAGKMNSFDAQSFTASMREAYRLQGEKTAALSKSGEMHQQIQQQNAAKAKQAFEQTWKGFSPDGGFLGKLNAADGAPAEEVAAITTYNQRVEGVRARAEQLAFGAVDEKGVATMATKAATLEFLVDVGIPRLEAARATDRQLIAQLTAELTSLRGGRGPAPQGDPAAQPAKIPLSPGNVNPDWEAAAKQHFGGRSRIQ